MSICFEAGCKIGRLTIINKGNSNTFYCSCDCGNYQNISLRNLTRGLQRCRRCQKYDEGIFPMPIITNKLMRAYSDAKTRCTNINCPKYYRYGGRGIKFLWSSVHQFALDMGEPPENTSLDRIDNDGNYCKENCRWVNNKTQANNRSSNFLITYKEKTQNLTAWALETNLDRRCISKRLSRGWSIEKALGF